MLSIRTGTPCRPAPLLSVPTRHFSWMFCPLAAVAARCLLLMQAGTAAVPPEGAPGRSILEVDYQTRSEIVRV